MGHLLLHVLLVLGKEIAHVKVGRREILHLGQLLHLLRACGARVNLVSVFGLDENADG